MSEDQIERINDALRDAGLLWPISVDIPDGDGGFLRTPLSHLLFRHGIRAVSVALCPECPYGTMDPMDAFRHATTHREG